jgi:hypothetical protein
VRIENLPESVVDGRVGFQQRIEFAFSPAFDFLQHFFGWEYLPFMQGMEHPLAIREKKGISDVEEKSFGWHRSEV